MGQQNDLIKKRILEELGYISYMEKKKINYDHDQAIIEKELDAIKKRKKYQIFSALFLVLAIICVIMSLIYDAKPIITSNITIRTIAFVGSFIFGVSFFIHQLIENQKRESIFRILSVFNKQNRNTV